MNKYVMLLPIVFLILIGVNVVSQAFAATTITVDTDKDVYDHTDVIIITGIVFPVDLNEVPVTIQIISPKGGIAGIDQVDVKNDGSFSATFETSTSLMRYDGVYQIKISYATVSTSITVELTNAIETSGELSGQIGGVVTGKAADIMMLDSKNLAGHIEYDLTCNADPSFFVNENDDSIVIYMNSIDDGILTITLHEELIKPFEDGTFVVIADNQEMQDFTQVGNTLTIPCLAGMEKIEIYGSWAIPEFGVIAAMILAVAIVSIIVVTAKTRLSIVPRY